MRRSFIITGASASGKTTLINEAKNQNYIYLPTHMTRKPRDSEKNGIDAIFINAEQFIANYNKGIYLEPSLDFALLKNLGIYYGTPSLWLNYLALEGYCASPVSIEIANSIVSSLKVCWVHLYCSDKDRYERLLARGITKEEARARMISGDSVNIPKCADLVISTSEYSPKQILQKINNFRK